MVVYLSEKIDNKAVECLRSQAEVVDTFDDIERIEGIIARGVPVTRDIISRAPALKAIGRHGVGYETVDIKAAQEYGVRVINVPRANATSVAEMIVARFLEMSRGLYTANARLRAGEVSRIAPPDMIGREVSGKVLGLIGAGNIATIAADMMRNAFGVWVYAYDPFLTAEQIASKGMTKVDTLEELLEISDMVNLNVHITDETRNMISGDLFNHFKPGAIFVNTARGGIVNEDDLYEALADGRLGAAAFDVFEHEPIGPDNKLLTLDNFSATPHIGGNTREALERTAMTVVENVLHVIKGEPAEGIVV